MIDRASLIPLLVAALALTACADDSLTTPLERPVEEPALALALSCTADMRAGTLGCAPPSSDADLPAGASALIVGGQDQFVTLDEVAGSVCYEEVCTGGTAGSEIFQADVTVKNLIPQALGTADGASGHAEGVRVFFTADPAATSGTGTVTVANEDGNAAFTGTTQPFFQYGGDGTGGADGTELGPEGQLAEAETSAARTWQWNVPATVSTFTFTVLVSAAVQYPDGWVELSPSSARLDAGGDQQLTATVMDVVGRPVTRSITWSTSDGAVATVNSSGLVSGVAAGLVTVTADVTDGPEASATAPLSVDVLTVDGAVAAGGAADGTSWANAFADLQGALAAAASGDQVWVAAGTYEPTSGIDRTVSFEPIEGVQLYGGFAGTETLRSQRDWETNETTLSGDIGAAGSSADNSHHVLHLDGTDATGADITAATVIDGFTITAGNADGSSTLDNSGGGILCEGRDTGGLCSPTVRNVVFNANSAANLGGAVLNDGSNGGTSSPTLVNVTFFGNSASDGGAMANHGSTGTSSPTLVNVVFNANSADLGGAMLNNGSLSSPTLVNVTFFGNSAPDGAAMTSLSSSPSITNSIFWGNTGGSVIQNIGASPSFDHSIVQSSGGSASWDAAFGTDGGGNLDANPRFADADGADDTAGTLDDDLTLISTSPAVNTGSNAPFQAGGAAEGITADLAGNPRIFDGPPATDLVDMGAYELQGERVLHVDHDVAPGGSGDGTSWANAFADLQDALAVAAAGDQIWVAAGTYEPTSGIDRTVSFQPIEGVQLYGGFAGTETLRSQRDWETNETTLSGDIGAAGSSADNSHHVLHLDGTDATGADITAATVIDGFTITAGNADGSGIHDDGGGLLCDGNGAGGVCSPTVRNVVFTANSAGNDGGALMNEGSDFGTSSPTLVNVVFTANSADRFGGAVANDGFGGGTSSPTLVNVVFNANSAGNDGGAIGNNGSLGGTSSPTLVNVTFFGNSAPGGGSAMFSEGFDGSSSPSITNSIFWGNTGTSVIHNLDATATPSFEHSIVEGSGGSASWDATLGTDGGGNLDADPTFVDANGADDTPGTLDDDLTLQLGSPAIDAGTNAPFDPGGAAEDVTTDAAGQIRIFNGTVDIGAHENQGT